MLLLLGHQLAALLRWSCSILEITQPSSPTTHHVSSKDGAGHVQVPVPGRQASSLLPVELLSLSNSAHPYQQEKQLQAPFSKVFKSRDTPGILPHTPGHSTKAHPTFYDLRSESLISHLDLHTLCKVFLDQPLSCPTPFLTLARHSGFFCPPLPFQPLLFMWRTVPLLLLPGKDTGFPPHLQHIPWGRPTFHSLPTLFGPS